ncbi:hypothetical protein [Actinobacillus pleuropneumoniae]|uniref:hypothetical protein n=1 Tax=Actinobacillus pleuropneumoniae TaxID=715 RepID=UPI003CFC1873
MARNTKKKVIHFVSVPAYGTDGNIILLNGRILLNDKKIVSEMFAKKRQWKIIIGGICRDSDGKTSMTVFDPLITEKMYLQDRRIQAQTDFDINQVANEVDDKLDLLSQFFLVTPNINEEISDDYLFKLFFDLGVYDRCYTPREMARLREQGAEGLRSIDPTEYGNKSTWTILKKHGINNFADFRNCSLKYLRSIKGIGEKRITALFESYSNCLNELRDDPRIKQIFLFEQEEQRQIEIINQMNL